MQHQHCKNIITLLSVWQSGGEKNGAAWWAETCYNMQRSEQTITVITGSRSCGSGSSIKVKGKSYKNDFVLTSVTNVCYADTYKLLPLESTTQQLMIFNCSLFFFFSFLYLSFPLTSIMCRPQHFIHETISSTKITRDKRLLNVFLLWFSVNQLYLRFSLWLLHGYTERREKERNGLASLLIVEFSRRLDGIQTQRHIRLPFLVILHGLSTVKYLYAV